MSHNPSTKVRRRKNPKPANGGIGYKCGTPNTAKPRRNTWRNSGEGHPSNTSYEKRLGARLGCVVEKIQNGLILV